MLQCPQDGRAYTTRSLQYFVRKSAVEGEDLCPPKNTGAKDSRKKKFYEPAWENSYKRRVYETAWKNPITC